MTLKVPVAPAPTVTEVLSMVTVAPVAAVPGPTATASVTDALPLLGIRPRWATRNWYRRPQRSRYRCTADPAGRTFARPCKAPHRGTNNYRPSPVTGKHPAHRLPRFPA